MHDVEPLAVLAAVDGDPSRLVLGDAGHHRRQVVGGVVAQPGAGGVRAGAVGSHTQADGALAAGLHHAARRLAQQREVRLQPLRVIALQVAQPVVARGDLLAVVGDEGEIVRELRGVPQLRERVQVDRQAGLHVDRAAAEDDVLAGVVFSHVVRDVVRNRHRVDVPGKHHAVAGSAVGAGAHGVAEAGDLEAAGCFFRGIGKRTQRGLDGVGDGLLAVGGAGDVDELAGQLHRVGVQVEFLASSHARHLTPPTPTRAGKPCRLAAQTPTGRHTVAVAWARHSEMEKELFDE